MAAYRLKENLTGKRLVLQMSGCNASPDEIIEASKRDAFTKGLMQ
ncbi:MAG TPA: hypothetical protein VMW89_01380 [Desulfatiglandales bacterium]|nr:hypothetical protein [Desulfatiglandales bacterium]